MLRSAILLLSLSSGLFAAFLMFNSSDGRGVAVASEPVEVAPMQEVLIAAADLVHGEILTESSVYWQPWPESAINGALVTRAAQPDAVSSVIGRYVRGNFSAGEPIRLERLAEVDSRLLSASLPSGQRAVALRISAESTAGGFVLPNDRVDVVLTVSENTDQGRRPASRVIARNVRVLAIDQLVDPADADPLIGSTATLELGERQVEVVLAAAASGMLSLALRSAADHQLQEPDPDPMVLPHSESASMDLAALESEARLIPDHAHEPGFQGADEIEELAMAGHDAHSGADPDSDPKVTFSQAPYVPSGEAMMTVGAAPVIGTSRTVRVRRGTEMEFVTLH